MHKIGCNLNVDSFQTNFKHPVSGENVVLFFDPCHALKLIRNCIAQYGVMINDNDKIIHWNYIVQLNDLQEREQLHLANKLRK